MPQLNVRMGKSGKIESYMNNGIYDYISSYRQGGKAAIENVLAGNFHEASRILRKIQNEKFKEMSASSSYRTLYRDWETDRKSTRLNSSHITRSRMPSSA